MKSSSHKIAVFIPSFRGGGAERVLIHLSNELATRDLQVSLLVGTDEGPYRNEINDAVNVIVMGKSSVSKCFAPLIRYLRRERPNTLFSTMNYCNTVISLAAWLSGTRPRVVLREALTLKKELGGKRWLTLLTRFSYARASTIIFVAEGQRREFQQMITLPASVDMVTIKNVPTDRLIVEKSLQAPKPPLPWKDDVPFFLAAGRLSEQKDFHTLIEAFKIVRQDRLCRLIILGDGPLKDELKSQAEDSGYGADIWMPGFVSNPYSYMRLASVVVLSSLNEGFPNVLAQAVALGKVCVSTDCDFGPAELFSDYAKGYLVAVGDSEAMASSMVEAIEGHALSAVVDQNEIDQAIDNWVSKYESVLVK